MTDSDKNLTEAILAVLRIAREAGGGKLARTALTKFVYMFDLYAAEEAGGKIFSGAEWKFWHFGPYAEALDTRLDALAAAGSIQMDARENGDKEYTLFYLGEWSTAKTPRDLGLSPDIGARVAEMIKLYSFDLPSLLNHVYFETAPMRGAKPGATLDFSTAERRDWKRDVKPHRFGVKDPARARRIKDLAAKIGTDRRAQAFVLTTPPIYDAHFERAVADADLDLPVGPHSARLEFE